MRTYIPFLICLDNIGHRILFTFVYANNNTITADMLLNATGKIKINALCDNV